MFLGNGKLSVWASAKVGGCYSELKQEDEDRQSIVQHILRKCQDFMRRIVVSVKDQGGGHFVVRTVTDSRLNITFGGFCVGTERSSAAGSVRLVADSGMREIRTESWSYNPARSARDAMFRPHAAPQGMCDKLINALKILANQQKDGDSPVKMVVQGWREMSKLRTMDRLRYFIMVDDHQVV